MRKKLTLSLLSLSLAGVVLAQEKVKQNPFGKRNINPVVRNILTQQAHPENAVAKTTNSGQRLIATAQRYLGMLEDSSTYTWSGNRSTVHTQSPEDLFYTGASYYSPYEPVDNFPTNFLRRNITQKPDVATNYYDDGNGFTLQTIVTHTYNSNNDLTKHDLTQPSSWDQLKYYNLSYNAGGKISKIDEYVDTTTAQAGTYILNNSLYCYYDNGGKLVKDSIVSPGFGNYAIINEYLNDASGKDTAIWTVVYDPFSGTYALQSRYTYEYYPSGMVKAVRMFGDDMMGNIVLQTLDSFTYTGANTFPSFHGQYYYSMSTSGILDYGNETNYTLNANGDVQNVLMHEYDASLMSWDSLFRYAVTYNSFANPSYLTYDEYNGSGWDNNAGRINYYYIGFTNVPETKKSIALSLYPNPATDMVTLSAGTDAAATITVADMQGRLVQQYKSTSSTIKIDLKNLPAGMYLVKYETATSVGTTKILKQ